MPVTSTGEMSVDRPRGVRSARRTWASATAEAAVESPGKVIPHAARVGTARRAPVDPGDASTRANAIMPMAWINTTAALSPTRPAAAGATFPDAAARVEVTYNSGG